ncbi:unnamed protein product [Trifolium pratense]|uniref:Uncharacterized protein n=1 Tax=Trifolium pratense TaxID=57577 RepID=A0ACB0K645_TRIPR|nr:unnamed protein product [Trifolium pratense]
MTFDSPEFKLLVNWLQIPRKHILAIKARRSCVSSNVVQIEACEKPSRFFSGASIVSTISLDSQLIHSLYCISVLLHCRRFDHSVILCNVFIFLHLYCFIFLHDVFNF